MATASLIPVSEYLRSSYEPDCDYVNGEVRGRNMGELSHGVLQSLLAALFNANSRAWNCLAGTDVRVQVRSDRFRVPDVCVLRRSDPFHAVVQTPPLICMEVLSPCDTIHSLDERIEDYRAMGVEHIWVVDPVSRHAWLAAADGSYTRVAEGFAIAGSPIRISLPQLFAAFDDLRD